MVQVSTHRRESIERRSPILFLVAGSLLVGYALLNGIAAFTDVAYETVEDVVGPAGLLLGLVSLLGLYPGLADRSPVAARVGALCAALGALSFSAITVQGLAVLAGMEPSGWLAFSILPATIGMIGGYLSFGVACFRTGGRSRTVGVLLVVPATVFAAMLSQAVLFVQFGLFSETVMTWSAVAISGGQALAHLAIGYALRTRVRSTERGVRSGDVAAS